MLRFREETLLPRYVGEIYSNAHKSLRLGIEQHVEIEQPVLKTC